MKVKTFSFTRVLYSWSMTACFVNDPDYVISFVEWAYGNLSEDQIRAEYDELVGINNKGGLVR